MKTDLFLPAGVPETRMVSNWCDSPAPAPFVLGPTPAEAASVLWVDDDVDPDDASVRLLAIEGLRADCAPTGTAALMMARARSYAAFIIDLHLPDMHGLTVLQRLIADGQRAPAIILTGCYMEPESEVLARRLGAADFRCKPIDPQELAKQLRTIIDTGPRPPAFAASDAPAGSNDHPHDPSGHEVRFGIVAASEAMRGILAWIDQVAPTRMPVLLTGETGTGKELVARALHRGSPRRAQPFVAVNCGAIPEGLLESELFGHRRGAFTGAVEDKKGLFEEAANGTLFLDEIGDMPLSTQARLLRFLEDGEVRRLGDTRTRHVDLRVLAATNQPLLERCAQNRFRRDLYFRLAVAHRRLPALRERVEDIEALVAHWMPALATASGKWIVSLGPGALALLRRHVWPGNVRELRNVLEYAVCLASTEHVTERDIAAALSREQSSTSAAGRAADRSDAERTLSVLEQTHWNRTQAARSLGIDRKTLWRRLRRFELAASEKI